MFDGTIESLEEQVGDLPIRCETQIATLLIQYEQMEETTSLSDQHLLEEASRLLQERLQTQEVDWELAHLAIALAYRRENWSSAEQVVWQYRQRMLPLYEAAWAWWHQVDFLALARNAPATIAEQRALCCWAREFFAPAHCLCTLADNTQAFNWVAQGMEREWFDHCQQLLASTPKDIASRFDRFYDGNLSLMSLSSSAAR